MVVFLYVFLIRAVRRPKQMGKEEKIIEKLGKEVFRACLHGGGGPQIGEVTRVAVVEKWPAFTCKLTTPGSRGDVTRSCCVVARHVNRENGGRTTHFGGQCAFPLIICFRCNISALWLFTFYFGALANVT